MKQYKFHSENLVVINEITFVSVYKYEKYNFDEPFLQFQPQKFFIGKSKISSMTEFSEAYDSPNFYVNTILLECEDNENIDNSGLEIFKN